MINSSRRAALLTARLPDLLAFTVLSLLLPLAALVTEFFAQQPRGVVRYAAQPLLHGLVPLEIFLHRAVVDLWQRHGLALLLGLLAVALGTLLIGVSAGVLIL
jgi:hypothetical protein